jgi:hypothetical protein
VSASALLQKNTKSTWWSCARLSKNSELLQDAKIDGELLEYIDLCISWWLPLLYLFLALSEIKASMRSTMSCVLSLDLQNGHTNRGRVPSCSRKTLRRHEYVCVSPKPLQVLSMFAVVWTKKKTGWCICAPAKRRTLQWYDWNTYATPSITCFQNITLRGYETLAPLCID